MIVNGKKVVLQKKISVKEFLEQEGYDTTKVVVEKDGAIVSQKQFATEPLCDDNKLEIVCFVGGG